MAKLLGGKNETQICVISNPMVFLPQHTASLLRNAIAHELGSVLINQMVRKPQLLEQNKQKNQKKNLVYLGA